MRLINYLTLFLLLAAPLFADEPGQWSVEKANEWYKNQPWILGCNFVPSTAVNDVEIWQAETFDLAAIDKELGWAAKWKINSIRVFLNYVVWEADAEGLIKRFEQFLTIADKHGISVMPVLFDDCNFSGGVAKVGKQPDPVPCVILGGWVSSPPRALRDNPESFPKLKAYVQGIVKHFGNDKRVIVWDLYNEPYNNFHFEPQGETHPLMEQSFAWAREVKPRQPLTVGVWWGNFDHPVMKRMMQLSDVVSFHGYDAKKGMENKIKICSEYGRPIICTEWMSRPGGSAAASVLPVLKEKNAGGYLWGLVNGRTQANFDFGSTADKPRGNPWKHDLMHNDGTPYDPAEFELFNTLAK
ncbi:hypothetical protein FACS189419_05870 [Planctomycetales bacterium]|nr:hypothetical protein FACS189419_05870 [Planctomycetales bacterium]